MSNITSSNMPTLSTKEPPTYITIHTGGIVMIVVTLSIIAFFIYICNKPNIDNKCKNFIIMMKNILCFNCCKSYNSKKPTKYSDREQTLRV